MGWAQQDIGLVVGAPQTDGATVLIASLSAGTATLTCNGGSQSVTLAAIGTDRGTGPAQAGYYGHITVSGLPARGTRYPFTVSLNGNTRTGTVTTSITATQRGKLWYVGCNNHGHLGGIPGSGWIRIAKSLRTVALPQYGLFVDDTFGYIGGFNVNDTASTGHSHTGEAQFTLKAYDYALGYMCATGLLGDQNQLAVRWGGNLDMQYCFANMPMMIMPGDHEFGDDCRFDTGTNYGEYEAGLAMWNTLIGPLMPTSIDAGSLAWAHDLGPVRIIAADRVTNGSAQYNAIAANPGTIAMTSMLGNGQVDAMKTAANTDHPFKLLAMPFGDRYLEAASTAHENQSGQQHPLFNHCLPEFQRLYTADGNTPLTLMDNPKTNGTDGVFLAWHGDTHRAGLYLNKASAYTGNLAEDWTSWFHGTTTGSINFGLQAGAATNCINGGSFGGTEVVYTQESGVTEHAHHRWHTLMADIRGDLATPELHVHLKDEAGRGPSAVLKVGSNMPNIGSINVAA